MDKITVLKQHFGHGAFRPGQEALVDALLDGRDALGVMPTGAGKSVCYQLPALLMKGTAVVVSPLISLMKDQVSALRQAGVAAAYINSSLTGEQYRTVLSRVRAGRYKILYVAPERLATADFAQYAAGADIALLAVDEAHCVSQWGQDFRPSYLKIAGFIDSLPRRPVVGAFTATATAAVRQDIERLLALKDPLRVTTGFDRPNLYFEVARPKNKYTYVRDYILAHPGQSGIVYCATRKAVETVCGALRQGGVAATRYHAGLDDAERLQNQEDFVFDRARVMVATNAFGMGIDKSNVGFVLHYNMPKNIESYYQEAGRAGRDGEKASCILLYSGSDVQTAKYLIANAEENEALSEAERAVVRARDYQRLEQMVAYCKTTGCLRAFLLDYFGEKGPENCGNCGSCCAELVESDITIPAQKILSAVARVGRQYPHGLGLTMIVRLLRGSREQRVLQLGLDRLLTYGAMRDASAEQIRGYVDCLLDAGYLALDGDEYPVLRLTARAAGVLYRGERVVSASRRAGERSAAQLQPGGGELLEKLKTLRAELARRENVPAYIIFSNAALGDMAARQPRSMAEFLQVAGVGQVKAARYGEIFLEEIRAWTKAQAGTL